MHSADFAVSEKNDDKFFRIRFKEKCLCTGHQQSHSALAAQWLTDGGGAVGNSCQPMDSRDVDATSFNWRIAVWRNNETSLM